MCQQRFFSQKPRIRNILFVKFQNKYKTHLLEQSENNDRLHALWIWRASVFTIVKLKKWKYFTNVKPNIIMALLYIYIYITINVFCKQWNQRNNWEFQEIYFLKSLHSILKILTIFLKSCFLKWIIIYCKINKVICHLENLVK